jgi:hypothetical protein
MRIALAPIEAFCWSGVISDRRFASASNFFWFSAQSSSYSLLKAASAVSK